MSVGYKNQTLARKLVKGPHVKSAISKFKDFELSLIDRPLFTRFLGFLRRLSRQ